MSKLTWFCIQCGRSFQRYKSQVQNPKTVTCSKQCRSAWMMANTKGDQNPNYRGGKYVDPTCACGKKKDPRSIKCALCAEKSSPAGGDRFSDAELRVAVRESTDYSQVATLLKCNRKTSTARIIALGLDISHFDPGSGRPIPLSKLLVKGSVTRRGVVKKAVRRHGLLPYVCVECGSGPTWNNKELVLELDHANGDSTDNRLDNLRFLCPNCHSQTDTHRGKNRPKKG